MSFFLAGAEALEEAIGEAAFYAYGGAAGATAASAGPELKRLYLTPERPVTPPPKITPTKRLREILKDSMSLTPSRVDWRYARRVSPNGLQVWGPNRPRSRTRGRRHRSPPYRTIPRIMPQRYITNPIAELKVLGFTGTNVNFVNTTWQWAPLNTMSQGTSSSTRLGNRVFIESIELNISMNCIAGTNNQVGAICRFVVVMDRQANGAVIPGIPSFFQDDNVLSVRSVAGFPRYLQLKNIQRTMQATQVSTGGTPGNTEASMPEVIHVYIPVRRYTQYQSNAGTISDILTNSICYGMLASTNNTCQVQMRGKLTFRDA